MSTVANPEACMTDVINLGALIITYTILGVPYYGNWTQNPILIIKATILLGVA